ncbi:MAG: PorV/PorQ family protein [Melioribacteraceae bacterium]|nr:PorV/PorQ family protein [Melioribacteraceae bacterium]
MLLLVFTVAISAQSAGKAGLSFLKIGFGARNLGMSDLGVAGVKDVSAINYNPAQLVDNTQQLMFNHNEWIQDVSTEIFAGQFQFWGLPFAIGVNTTSVSDLEYRDVPGPVQTTFDVSYFYSSISTAFNLTEQIRVGATMKYIYESMWRDDAAGIGYDLGLLYSDVIENLELGLSFRNLGSMDILRNEKTELPADMRFGAAYDYELESLEANLQIIGGVQKYLDVDETHIHFGGEFLYKKIIALRGGYVTSYESKGISAGLGLLYNDFNFDYAYSPFDFDLGSAHTISLKYTF